MSLANNKPILPGEQSLDELLDAARSDAGYLEGERARHAILNDVMDRAIQSQPVRRFTPLKIGITIMTSLTVGALGLIALGVFAPTPKPNILQQKPFDAVPPSATQAIASPALKPLGNAKSRYQVVKVAAKAYGRDTAWLAPVKMETVKPIVLTAEQARQLGIVCDKNGNIVYRYAGMKGAMVSRQTYRPDGSLTVALAVSDSDSGLTLPEIRRARIITTAKGEKRFFQFEDTTFSRTFSRKNSRDSSHSVTVVTTLNSGPISLEMSGKDSASFKKMGIDPGLKMSFLPVFQDTASPDSIAVKKLMASAGLSDAEMAKMLNGGLDSALLWKMVNNIASMVSSDKPNPIKDLGMSMIKNMAQNQPDINKLVPVEVQNRDSVGTLNALVFWFEPSASLATVLGNQYPPSEPVTAVVQTSSRGALQAVAIAPNPASGSTTLRYTLGDTRAIRVAVYDITGQKILDVAQATSALAGTGEIKLDLSKLRAGVYVVAVTTDKGEELTQRMVVEN